MTPAYRRPAKQLALQIPVIVLVLAFTAIPAELQLPSTESIAATLRIDRLVVPDIVANLMGYVPVGIVLGSRGLWQAIGIATSVSVFAEASQLFSVGRFPSLLDLMMNVIGTAIGMAVSTRWKLRTVSIEITRRNALLAAALALAYIGLGPWVRPRLVEEAIVNFIKSRSVSGLPVNARGATSAGRLEAHWSFDGNNEDVVLDSSGHGLNGVLVGGPALVAGISGGAVRLNGVDQHVTFGNPTELRLTGSMTLSAWINPSSFPRDDAAIVSTGFRVGGYQLDTTVDRGPRTIGFKFRDAWGRLSARYGRTPLRTNTWYHVAGVYDAGRQTLDVYLNGRQDNGCLLGNVPARQHISDRGVHVGRRADRSEYEFAGLIDDVQIHSRALTPSEIEVEMGARTAAQSEPPPPAASEMEGRLFSPESREGPCLARVADADTAGLVVAYGLLVAVACAGLWPAVAGRIPLVAFSFAAGFLLFPRADSALPLVYLWIIPVLTVVGGVSAAVSVQPRTGPPGRKH